MRTLSTTEKAEAWDNLMKQIRDREPSVNTAIAQRGGSSAAEHLPLVERFLVAFDALTDNYKRRTLGGR